MRFPFAKYNLVGIRFGKLIVLEFAGSKNNRRTWLCKCDCGKQKIIIGTNLKKGSSISCGCLIGKSNIKPNCYYAKNQVYQSYKSNAKKRKIIFDLTFDDLIVLSSKN